MNNQVFIPSNGIGKLRLDVFDMHWYYYESTLFNIDNEISEVVHVSIEKTFNVK